MGTNINLDLIELKKLVFEQGEHTQNNKDRLFTLAKQNNDIETIKQLRDIFNFKDAVEYMEKLDKNPLDSAIENNNIDLLKTLIKEGVELKNINLGNFTSYYSFEFIEMLLKAGVDVDAKDLAGQTKLFDASIGGDYDMVKLLLNFHANINVKDDEGYTALRYAVLMEHDDIVALLLERGAEVNIADIDGDTPLMVASRQNQKNIVEFLIAHGTDVNAKNENKQGVNSLMYAIGRKHIEIVELLIEKGMDLNDKVSDGSTALILAVMIDDIDMITLLIKNSAEVNTQNMYGNTALMEAIRKNNVDAVRILMEHGAKTKFTIINTALANNNIKILQILIDNGLKINEIFFNCIFKAKINYQILQLLFDNNFADNIVDYLVLFHSVIHDTDMAKFLILKTKNPRVYPLFYTIAQNKNNLEILNFLEEGGIISGNNNIYVKVTMFICNNIVPKVRALLSFLSSFFTKKIIKKYGEREAYEKILDLYSAEEFNLNLSGEIKNDIGIKALELIIKKRPESLNELDINGMSALMWACKLNKIDVVQLLLNYKVDIHVLDKQGKTALQYAIDSSKITNLLRDYDKVSMPTHNPKKLIKLLTNFREDTPIKYTTHIWDMSFKDDYGNFKVYLSRVKEQWNEIEEDLKKLSPRLHTKIYNFLINTDVNSKGWCSKDGDDINIGWSSLNGLEEWCNDGNDPFNFKLEKSYKIENKTISTFGEVINLFKQEIQIRNENNMLKNIFINLEVELDEQYDGVFEFELINLEGKSFYMDTKIFKDILTERIFKDITKPERHKYSKIRIEMAPNSTLNYHELRIMQRGSQSNQSSYDMLNHYGADTSIIKSDFTNLCDWSIESSSETENYRINYLKSEETIDDIEPLDYKPEGYTHIMRFYK